MTTQLATFGAGCFWGIEAKFARIEGVLETAVGYAGGQHPKPDYKLVCSDTTGHAEVVQVSFDPSRVSFIQLLEAFWGMHDATTLNRQGPDYGSQYRSAVFYHSEEQHEQAQANLLELQASPKYSGKKIVTQIAPFTVFHRAEEYHQKYLAKRAGQH